MTADQAIEKFQAALQAHLDNPTDDTATDLDAAITEVEKHPEGVTWLRRVIGDAEQ